MKKGFWGLLIFLSTVYCLLSTASAVYAQVPQDQAPAEWTGKCIENVPGVGNVATIQGFECIFRNIVRVLTPIAGLAVFIMLIVGSFQLMTAGGEVKEIQKARKTLTSAVIGLVAFIGIWFILLLIKEITGVDVTKFEVPK